MKRKRFRVELGDVSAETDGPLTGRHVLELLGAPPSHGKGSQDTYGWALARFNKRVKVTLQHDLGRVCFVPMAEIMDCFARGL